MQTGVEDPFSKLAESKKQRVATNKKSQLQNAKLADKEGQLPATLKLAQGLGAGSGSNSKAAGPRALPKNKRRELKEEVRGLLANNGAVWVESLYSVCKASTSASKQHQA
eukprot:1138535-Pelagomonas_calceolata.AAC.1